MMVHWKKIEPVCIFSIAMAALEGAVVVYLRELYYPDGFTVAMRLLSKNVLIIEMVREVATIIMLSTIGYLVGKTLKERYAYFLISFAVWDIFYYIWLKIFIGWPASFFEWDILFLIPFTWLAPVIAPIICSLSMIALAIVLLGTNPEKQIPAAAWGLLVAGSLLVLFTFMRDYGHIIISNGLFTDYAHLTENENFIKIASTYIPESFSWSVFWIGEFFIGLGVVQLINSDFAFHSISKLRKL